MRSGSLYELKPAFVDRLRPAVERLVAREIRPTTVTLSAVPVSVLIAAALVSGRDHAVLWLVVPLLAAGLMAINAIDGRVARLSGATSQTGAVVNELVDRLSDVLLVGSGLFLVAPGLASATLLMVLIAEIVALVGWGSTGERALVGVMGKPDRAMLVSISAVAAFFFGPEAFTIAFLLLCVGVTFTVYQRVRHVLDDARSLDLETNR